MVPLLLKPYPRVYHYRGGGPLKRSGTIHTIHELSAQGKSIRAIAREIGIARNTVRRYLRGKPEAVPRPKRGPILDPYKPQIHPWIHADHFTNCEPILQH